MGEETEKSSSTPFIFPSHHLEPSAGAQVLGAGWGVSDGIVDSKAGGPAASRRRVGWESRHVCSRG